MGQAWPCVSDFFLKKSKVFCDAFSWIMIYTLCQDNCKTKFFLASRIFALLLMPKASIFFMLQCKIYRTWNFLYIAARWFFYNCQNVFLWLICESQMTHEVGLLKIAWEHRYFQFYSLNILGFESFFTYMLGDIFINPKMFPCDWSVNAQWNMRLACVKKKKKGWELRKNYLEAF